MRVLVCAASKHGSTAEIAERIFSVLDRELNRNGGHATVELCAPERVPGMDGYDAVVLGSAVYMGRWLADARELVSTHAETLATRPVWLFSSGPVGQPAKPDEDPIDAAAMVAATHARGHRLFSGRLDRHRLGLREKAVVVAFRAPEGDFRDWPAIEAWATDISVELTASTSAHRAA
jgi:menaquinone-dependent protoporphyrinogen oxidase